MTDASHDSPRSRRSNAPTLCWTVLLLVGVGAVILAVREPATDLPFAEIRVGRDPRPFFPETPPPRVTLEEFRRFLTLQTVLVRSPRVLTAALRNPELANLEILKTNTRPSDWLEQHLEVSIRDEGYIRVSLRGVDRKHALEAARVINAVVEGYLIEEVARAGMERRERLSDLQEVLKRRERETEKKQQRLETLSAQVGPSGRAQGANQRFAERLQREHARVRFAILQQEMTLDESSQDLVEATESEELAELLKRLDHIQTALDEVDASGGRNHLFNAELGRLRNDIKTSKQLTQRLSKELEYQEIDIENSPNRITLFRKADPI
ncbi:MAG: hypothetical protein CMJ48_02070 [Planctomycetaceae bacterium]|nr:hypothetical protein [Planctomycetaceae bacterium]